MDARAESNPPDAYRDDPRLLTRRQLGPRLRGKLVPFDLVQQTPWQAHRAFGRSRGGADELTAWPRKILAQNLAEALRVQSPQHSEVIPNRNRAAVAAALGMTEGNLRVARTASAPASPPASATRSPPRSATATPRPSRTSCAPSSPSSAPDPPQIFFRPL
jgi:RNA polymerase sigma-70 factor (ECF subfamily)